MPLIEKLNGEGLIVGRIGIKYTSSSSETYSIGSEVVSSNEYNVAIYVDSICDNAGNPVRSSEQVNQILTRVETLMSELNIKGRYFSDSGETIAVDTLKDSTVEQEKNSVIRELESMIDSENYGHFKQILLENPDLCTTINFGVNGESLLHFVSKKGLVDFCKALLDLGVDVDIAGKNSETPLVRASHKGHFQVVKLLVERGANVDGLEEGIATPLIAAAAAGHEEIVYFLLERGADKNRTDKELNQSALEIAKSMLREPIVEIIDSFA